MAIDEALLAALSPEESKSVRRLVEKGIKLPPRPHAVEELRHLLTHGVTDLRVITRSINQDPGMVAALFRVVQSAAYRRMHPFESVEQILQAIGTRQACNIVQAVALAAAIPSKHNARAFEAFWARSGAVGQIAMLVAEDRVPVCNIFPDQAYLAGIFHGCGVPVLMQRFSTYCKTMHADEQGAWLDLAEEDKRFNADHCVIGYLVARYWKLPDFICDAIRFQRDMDSLGNHAARTMVAILQMSIQLYYQNMSVANPDWVHVRAAVADELGLHPDALPEFMDEILERYQGEVR